MSMLVDTNIIGELARRRPDPGVVAWANTVTMILLSVITVEEIFFGLAWKPNARIQQWFEEFLAQQCSVVPVTLEVARVAGMLRGRFAARGTPRSQADMLIAATAQMHQRTVVTRNVRDFEGCGIALFNPFR